MKILVTGAKGFIGKHTVLSLKKNGHEIFEYDVDSKPSDLDDYIAKCEFIIHLAGINRPLTTQEFYDGNSNFTKLLVDKIIAYKRNDVPVIMSSSIQASLDNDYGKSKKMGEDFLFSSGLKVFVFRLANVFGKWCRPNYNSAAATFCYNIAHGLPIEIRDPNYVVHYNYIDDIVASFNACINGEIKPSNSVLSVTPVHDCSLGRLASLLKYFKEEIESERHLPLIHDQFELKLFKTFCDYLSDEGYSFNFASDNRGSFEELYKSKKYGQISENISFPHIVKGGHYHTYKEEIFYTVVGSCQIKQRNVKTNELVVNNVNGDKPEPINIIPYCTHSIENVGEENSHTIMWISEIYNPNTHDTFKEDV